MTRLTAAAMVLVMALAALLSLGPDGAVAQKQAARPTTTEVATFAGGCFWCVEQDFDRVEGVISTVSGYMGGHTPNPTYRQVASGFTGHLEVVQVTFDPSRISYKQLVEGFWRTIDPYDEGGQFCDRGEPYQTAIFTHTPEQRRIADAAKAELQRTGPQRKPVATTIRDAQTFNRAEDYHQDFHTKSPFRYGWYRLACRRDATLETVWGKKAGH